VPKKTPKAEARIQNSGARSGKTKGVASALRADSIEPQARHYNDLPHAHPIVPSHFTLREDGQIVGVSDFGSRVSESPDARRQTPDPITPKLVYHDDARKVWLYHGNSLELLEAIYAKYKDEGRFDCIFADPPYFLSNGGIT